MRLAEVTTVQVPRLALTHTQDALRAYGEQGCEGLVLWTGSVDGALATVRHALVPEQNPIRNEDGVGYFVEGPTLFRLAKYLEKEKLRLIGQVHSHPTEAYHSDTDDRYAIVTEDGGFSVVVPDFARAPMTLAGSAIYRLRSGTWEELSRSAVDSTFRVG